MSVNAAETELKFGIFPNLSTRMLIETYQPVADALSKELKRPVALQTASDFKTFFERTQAGEYDLVLTAPHLAWLAHRDQGYRPLFVYQRNTEGILVVRADSRYKTLGDLRDKTIAMADSLAITVMRLESDLAKAGLVGGRHYTKIEVGTHNNAALHVHDGQSDAAIMGGLPFQRLPEGMRKNLRVIKATAGFPGQVYLVNPRVSNAQEWAIRGALRDFMRSSQGKVFLDQGGFEGLRMIGSWELRQFDVDGQLVKQRLYAGRDQAGK
jgi:phosphonate transport system substrate-binding protein